MKPGATHFVLLSEWLKHKNYYGPGKDAYGNFGGADCATSWCAEPDDVGVHLAGTVCNYLFFDGHVKGVAPSVVAAKRNYYCAFLPGKGLEDPRSR